MRRRNLTDERFERLVVVEELGTKVRCVCDCGEEKILYRSNVMAGYSKSCGCLQRERTSTANTKHGLRSHPLWNIFRAMHRRCYNPNHRAYRWYGALGIKVEERWHNFEYFVMDMAKEYAPGLTIDRKDSTKDYGPSNCRWLSKSENSKRGSYGA